jgi:hypothetical protein
MTNRPADFVNPKELPEGKSIVEYLVEETDGGLDYTYDATGVVSLSPALSHWNVAHLV